MADKRASAGSTVVTALVGAGAAFAARKVLFFGWTKITGKEPPEHPEGPAGRSRRGADLGRRAGRWCAHGAAAGHQGHGAPPARVGRMIG